MKSYQLFAYSTSSTFISTFKRYCHNYRNQLSPTRERRHGYRRVITS